MTDIDAKAMRVIATAMELEYLGPAEPASFPGSFPVDGLIWTPNNRLMDNLACRRQTKSDDGPTRNVIFLVNTGSPYTYLCQEAIKSLIGSDNLPQTLFIKIHSEQVIQTYISPKKNGHFADVNVLRMDFLAKNKANPRLNFFKQTFTLYKVVLQ
jgi:hypothetical protein